MALQDAANSFDQRFELREACTPSLLDRVFRLRYQVYCVENSFLDAAMYPDGRERTATISFVVGGSTGLGPIYSLEFTAVRSDGSRCKLLNTTVVGVGGTSASRR